MNLLNLILFINISPLMLTYTPPESRAPVQAREHPWLLRGYANDVYFQVGLITVIGLSAKNAILIIEFAKDLQAQGKGLLAAAIEAAHLRFRPIVMTSMAFGLGVMPLVLASGAGSASQRAIGTGVLGGVITGTVLAVMFVPLFFVVVRSLFKGSARQQELNRRHAEEAGIEPHA